MDRETGRVICNHCSEPNKPTLGSACPELLNDEAAQVLCLKHQGWTKKRTKWRCPDCTVRFCNGPEFPDPRWLRCRHGHDAFSSGSGSFAGGPATPSAQQPPPPPPPVIELGVCSSVTCIGCLEVCTSCAPFRLHIYSPFVQQLQNLTILLNSLPCGCLPPFLLNPLMDQGVRPFARQLRQGMDHDNLSGSALVLALLRPHMYVADPVPLRLFGYPTPVELLAADGNPRSGRGPDNRRTNLVEGLCAYWTTLPLHPGAQDALAAVQDAWHVMRLRVDFALRTHSRGRSVNGHSVFLLALQVTDNALMG